MNPESAAEVDLQQIRDLDKAHVWHPFLNHSGLDENPLDMIVRGEGCTVTDGEGKEFLDAMAGLWCVNIGYGRKEVAEAVYRQLLELPYYPLSKSPSRRRGWPRSSPISFRAISSASGS